MKLKQLIREINQRNTESENLPVFGVNINKEFMPSVANIIGTDLSHYKIVKKGQFAVNLMHINRDAVVPVARLKTLEKALVSPAYFVFEVSKLEKIDPAFLEICFKESSFDRRATFKSGDSIRGNLDWNSFLDLDLQIPNLPKQKEYVSFSDSIQSVIQQKIAINNNLSLRNFS
jgi:type I restriction enzyme, S subunit